MSYNVSMFILLQLQAMSKFVCFSCSFNLCLKCFNVYMYFVAVSSNVQPCMFNTTHLNIKIFGLCYNKVFLFQISLIYLFGVLNS